MSVDNSPHFQIGHMCAGCPISNILHTGCVVDNSVVVQQKKVVGSQDKTDGQTNPLKDPS